MGKASRRKHERRRFEQLTIEGLPDTLKSEDVRIRRQHSGPKISDALLDVLKPFIEPGLDTEQMRALTEFAVFAWNLSLQPRIDRKIVQQHFSHLDEQMQQASMELLGQMVERKRKQHPQDRRPIASFQVHETDDGGWYITAAAAATGDQQAQAAQQQ